MELEKIENGIWRFRAGTPEERTPVSMRAFPVRSGALSAMPETPLPECAREIRLLTTPRGPEVRLPMSPEEDIYGLGLQLRGFNHRGRKRSLRVNADPAGDAGDSHAPVPFYVSTAGYGLFIDTFRHLDIYFGSNAPRGASRGVREVNKSQSQLSEDALYALRRSREDRSVIIDLRGMPGADIYLFSGNVGEAVRRYNLFSGGGCLPPMWGLGVWYRTFTGGDQAAVEALALELRRERMHVDVLGLEPGWQSHTYSCTYFWSNLFPEPGRLFEFLGKNGFKPNLWEHAFVYPAAEFYNELEPYTGDFEVWNGLVPDFALPEARRIFGEYHRRNLIRPGAAGFKLDECDNTDFNRSSWSFPDTARFPSGLDGEQMHGAFGVLYQRVIYDVYHSENRRTLSQVRSSGALAAPWPFVLYSDLYDHRQYIRGVVNAGFSGLLWAPEVRDCSCIPDLLRRMETAIFSAQALYNCWRFPSPPWLQTDITLNQAGVLMDDRESVTEVVRRYHEVRMALLPYLYSAFVRYRLEGVPPVRALVQDFEEDPSVRLIDDEYMLGPDLLVAPMTLEDGTHKRVYLPRGEWYDFWDGTKYDGGAFVELDAPYDKIPVFVRGGTILPLGEPVQYVDESAVFTLVPRIYGDKPRAAMLYEDDFTTFEYEKKAPRALVLALNGENRLELTPGSEKYRLK